MSFLPVAGLGSGAYSAKLLTGTRQRLSGFSQARQCGDVVLRAQRVDFAPVGANVGVFQGDVIGPVGSPPWPSPARVKSLTLRHELGDAADSLTLNHPKRTTS